MSGATIAWVDPSTWMPVVAGWVKPQLMRGALTRLRRRGAAMATDDDPDWLRLLEAELRGGLDEAKEALGEDLKPFRLMTFHGCRTEDAGVYFRDGLRVRRSEDLAEQAWRMVRSHPELAWMAATLDKKIAELDASVDEGRCFVALDHRPLLKDAAHYLIYGSEFLSGVFSHRVLRTIGVPTLLEIELPLHFASQGERKELAEAMLCEWTRHVVSGPRIPPSIDFTFAPTQDIPPEHVKSHSHPPKLIDPLAGMTTYRSPRTTCAYCNGGRGS